MQTSGVYYLLFRVRTPSRELIYCIVLNYNNAISTDRLTYERTDRVQWITWPSIEGGGRITSGCAEHSSHCSAHLTAARFDVPYHYVSPGSAMNINEMSGWQLTTLEHAKLISGITHARTVCGLTETDIVHTSSAGNVVVS